MKSIVCVMAFILMSAMPVHSKVKMSAGSTEKKPNIIFTLVPDSGLVINSEGPWKLEVLTATGFNLDKKIFDKKDFDASTGTFTVPVSSAAKNAKAKIKMVAFVCTKDKAKCYRDVLENELELTK